jgi:hypothetical protein
MLAQAQHSLCSQHSARHLAFTLCASAAAARCTLQVGGASLKPEFVEIIKAASKSA